MVLRLTHAAYVDSCALRHKAPHRKAYLPSPHHLKHVPSALCLLGEIFTHAISCPVKEIRQHQQWCCLFFVPGLMCHAIPDRFPSMKRDENVDGRCKNELPSENPRFRGRHCSSAKDCFWGPVLRDAPRGKAWLRVLG